MNLPMSLWLKEQSFNIKHLLIMRMLQKKVSFFFFFLNSTCQKKTPGAEEEEDLMTARHDILVPLPDIAN